MTSKFTFGGSRAYHGVLFISPHMVTKSTGFTRLAEAHAMGFVRRNTSIPVPKIYVACEYKGCVYIVMQRIKGTMTGFGWRLRSEASKQKILQRLKSMVEELRTLERPAGVDVANVDGVQYTTVASRETLNGALTNPSPSSIGRCRMARILRVSGTRSTKI